MKSADLINILTAERNSRINESDASKFVFRAYNNIIAKINESFGDSDITNADVDGLSATNHMKDKLKAMMRRKAKITPKSSYSTRNNSLLNELTKLMGLGEKKARDLIRKGLTSVDQLRSSPWFDTLPIQTQTALINEPVRKIPHAHIAKLEETLTNPGIRGLKVVLVGSYRRGAAFSRDIDIMLVSDSDIMEKYMDYLQRTFKCVRYSMGPAKMSLVFNPRPLVRTQLFYKIDAFLTPKKYAPAMILYATGSKTFNIYMRAKAKAAGYLLNQTGLYTRKDGKADKLVLIKSEKDFFAKLGMHYIDPEKRGGNSLTKE
jgi:DNA polymerase/3'-5' exonuclease PolX